MLPVTPTSTVLPQNKQCKLHVAKDHGKLQKGMEENMRRYAIYYVYAAIETLPFKLGHNVMRSTASVKADKSLIQNLTDTMLDKDPGIYNTEICEGVVNLESIR